MLYGDLDIGPLTVGAQLLEKASQDENVDRLREVRRYFEGTERSYKEQGRPDLAAWAAAGTAVAMRLEAEGTTEARLKKQLITEAETRYTAALSGPEYQALNMRYKKLYPRYSEHGQLSVSVDAYPHFDPPPGILGQP